MNYTKILAGAFISVFFTSCYYDNEEYLYGLKECSETISFKTDVSPLILNSCSTTGCHADVQTPILTDYSSISAHSDRILFRTSNGTMPVAGPLTADEIQTIRCWVEQGALDN